MPILLDYVDKIVCLQGENSELLKITEELKLMESEKIKCIEEKYCKRIAELQSELERKAQECCKLSNENDALVKENEYLKFELKAKDSELKLANERICQMDAEIRKLELEIKRFVSEIEKWKRKLEVRLSLLDTFEYNYFFILNHNYFFTGSSERNQRFKGQKM